MVDSGHSVDMLRYDSVKIEVHNSVCERITSFFKAIYNTVVVEENPKLRVYY